MPDEDKRGGNSLFANSFTPSQAYCDFLMNLENNCNDELYLHLKKLTDPNVLNVGNLILRMLNIVRYILKEEMVQK